MDREITWSAVYYLVQHQMPRCKGPQAWQQSATTVYTGLGIILSSTPTCWPNWAREPSLAKQDFTKMQN